MYFSVHCTNQSTDFAASLQLYLKTKKVKSISALSVMPWTWRIQFESIFCKFIKY